MQPPVGYGAAMDGPGASLLGGQRIAIDGALMGNPLIELDPMVAADRARLKHALAQAEGDEAAAALAKSQASLP